MSVWVCILAGGHGTRLWPASRPDRPKQYLPLAGEASLIRQTWERARPVADPERCVVVSVEAHEALVRRELGEVHEAHVWLEPQGRNTGPSVLWTLHEVQHEDPDGVVVFLPADHHVARPDLLVEAAGAGVKHAQRTGDIVLLGARPERAETGYGHIEQGEKVQDDLYRVRRFLEKPDARTAAELAARHDVLWNCGLFIIPVTSGLEIACAVSPELSAFRSSLPAAGAARRPGSPGRQALCDAFASVRAVPFDVAVLERTQRCAVIPLDAGWSDLGSWQAIWQVAEHDSHDNHVAAGCVVNDSSGCHLASDGPRIAALGVENLVIVAWGDAVLVCPRERAQEIRRMVAGMDRADPGGGEKR
ncbi:MAG: mannose-1-phosphate guanylyltransferase [Acidobacteriota bacterium]